MADIVTPAVRSRMMAGIRGKNTHPEMLIRRGLHRLGFRYRLHLSHLPGRPDLVLPRYRAAIFVHGCFWHGHGCALSKIPASRPEFWIRKLEQNRVRDAHAIRQLSALGWRSLVVWECNLRGPSRLSLDDCLKRISVWLETEAGPSEMPPPQIAAQLRMEALIPRNSRIQCKTNSQS